MKYLFLKDKCMRYWHAIVLFLVVGLSSSLGQSLKVESRKAIKSFDKGNYIKARDRFIYLYDTAYEINNTASYLARCYLELHEPEKACEVFKGLAELNDENTYLYSVSSYFSERFHQADSLLSHIDDTTYYDVKEARAVLQNARDLYERGKGYYIQNFGPKVNTTDREYSAVMYNDYNKLIYTTRKAQYIDLDNDGLAYEMIYSTSVDSMCEDDWMEPELLKMEGNQHDSHDASVQIYRSGTKMISYRNGDLHSHTLVDGVWQQDEGVIMNGLYRSNTHCYMTPDEKTLYFASDFTSHGHQLDLYMIQRDQFGAWSKPLPLIELNTEFDEDAPFLSSDGSLYFSSRGHNSMGGYDVFRASYDSATQTWSRPVNLGYPINTVAEDTYFTIEGKVGYMSSTRSGGYGSLDIYRVFMFNKVKISGVIYDENDQPVPGAAIEVKYDATHLRTYADASGVYELYVPIDRQLELKVLRHSEVLFAGKYTVKVVFGKENQNTHDFQLGSMDQRGVQYIAVQVRNDNMENPIIEQVPAEQERAWVDQLNWQYDMKRETLNQPMLSEETRRHQVIDRISREVFRYLMPYADRLLAAEGN